jgi:hypothetical protein
MDINDIATRLKNGDPVSDSERAYLIAHNPYALAAFMVDNNPGSVNLTLRKLGYNHLGFTPDKKALARQLEIFIERGNTDDLHAVLKNFNVMPNGLTQNLLNEIYAQLNS